MQMVLIELLLGHHYPALDQLGQIDRTLIILLYLSVFTLSYVILVSILDLKLTAYSEFQRCIYFCDCL
jgi:hypothetical protein